MSTDDQPGPTTQESHVTEVRSEIDVLLGNARAAITEMTSLQQAAAKAAADAELEATKAVEHVKEIVAKRDAVATAETEIQEISASSARRSSDIDDGVKFSISSKEQISTAANEVAQFAKQVHEQAEKATEILDSARELLEKATQKHTDVEPIIAEIKEHHEKIVASSKAAETAELEVNAARESAKANADSSATECKNVEDGRHFIEEQRKLAEQFASDAKANLDEATNTAIAVQAALVKAVADQEKAAAALEEIDANAALVDTARQKAEEDQKVSSGLAKIAGTIEERVNAYETQLNKMADQFRELHQKIESLLPGAASSGLASSFHTQKQKYFWPKTVWNGIFFVALAGIAGIGIAEIVHHWSGQIPNYDELLRSFLTRLPAVAALVWLALHASGKSRIANQLQEDYTYKEVVSRSFEGYKKEFASLPDHVIAGSPLATLCDSMVTIIASSPSRVYDKHATDPTPMSTASNLAKHMAEFAKQTKSIPKVEVTAS